VGGAVNVSGYAPQKVLPFIRITSGAPSPNGADPTGHALLLRERMPEIYAKTATLLEPVDYLGLRFTGRAAATPASMVLSWLTDNRPGAPLGYVDSLVRRARRDRAGEAARGCPDADRGHRAAGRADRRAPGDPGHRVPVRRHDRRRGG